VSEPPLFPAPPPRSDQAKVKPPVPREVNIAFAVWILNSLLGLVLQLFDTTDFVGEYQKQIAGTPQAAVLDPGTLKVIYIIAVTTVCVLMAFFAWKMRSGRKWARTVLAILAVFGLMTQAVSTGLSDVFAVIGVLIAATGLVFMFVPAANAYFNEFVKRR
jgi:hypothetical protein